MSHRQEVQAQVHNTQVLQRTCERLNYQVQVAPEGGKLNGEIFDGAIEGVAIVKIPGWKYDVWVKEDGSIVFDDYNGRWGNKQDIDFLLRDYADDFAQHQLVELEGHTLVSHQLMEDGTIELELDAQLG